MMIRTAKMMAVVVALAGFFAAIPAEAAKKVVTGMVNLNTAPAAELEKLPGVGPAASKRIIEHRQKTPFGRVEDLVKVKGFGKKKLEKLRPHLAVQGHSNLKLEGGKAKGQARASPPRAPRK